MPQSFTGAEALTVLLLLGACTGPASAGPVPSGPTEPPPSTSAAQPSPGPSGAETVAGDLPLVDAVGAWTISDAVHKDSLSVKAIGPGGLLVVVTQDQNGVQSLNAMVGNETNTVAFRAGQYAQNAHLMADGTVVYGLGDEGTGEFWVHRWNPGSGENEVVYESVGQDASWSETAVVGQTLYLTRPRDGRSCLDRMSLDDPSRTLEPIDCAPDGEALGTLNSAPDGTITYQTHADSECGTLHRIVADGDPSVIDIAGCMSRAVADKATTVWTGDPPIEGGGTNFFNVPLLAEFGGEVFDLGTAPAGSAILCEGSVYWQWDDFTAPSWEPSQLRRWTPGSGDVEVIYRSPDEDSINRYATSVPLCGPGLIGVQRMSWEAVKGQQFLTSPMAQ